MACGAVVSRMRQGLAMKMGVAGVGGAAGLCFHGVPEACSFSSTFQSQFLSHVE